MYKVVFELATSVPAQLPPVPAQLPPVPAQLPPVIEASMLHPYILDEIRVNGFADIMFKDGTFCTIYKVQS